MPNATAKWSLVASSVQAIQTLVLGIALAGVAACVATSPPSPAYDAVGLVYDANDLRARARHVALKPLPANNDELVCREEAPVGSHHVKNRCFTKEQAARIRRESQLWLRTGGLQGGGMVAR